MHAWLHSRIVQTIAFAAAASVSAAPAAAADYTGVYIVNESSGTVTVQRDAESVCVLEPSKSCMVRVAVGGSYSLGFVYANGDVRRVGWDGILHLCILDGGYITNCATSDRRRDY